MFLKFGDKNKNISVEEKGETCNKCGASFIVINENKKCECSNDSFYKKSKEILQKKEVSANSK